MYNQRLMSTPAPPSNWKNALHVFALFSFAVAQPLYDLLARNPEFFVVRQSRLIDALWLIVLLSLLLPGVLALLGAAAARLDARLGQGAHLLIVLVLTTLTAAPFLKRASLNSSLTLAPAALGIGVAAVFAYRRFQPVRLFLTVLSPAALIFPAVFLLASPVLTTLTAGADFPRAERVGVKAPVVFIVLDELPLVSLLDENYAVDPVRYPNFARLVKASTWHPNAITVSGATAGSVTAILTGRYPKPEALPLFTENPGNLFTLFSSVGEVHAVESATRLCPQSICAQSIRAGDGPGRRMVSLARDLWVVYMHATLPEDWRFWLPPIGANWMNFVFHEEETESYNDRSNLFRRFIESIEPGDEARLHFLHIFLPHVPWEYTPTGKRYSLTPWKTAGLDFRRDEWNNDPWATALGYRRHLLQVGFIDRLLGELLDRLQSTGLFDSSLIVVTADHGCSFWPGNLRRGINEPGPIDVLSVPLFIKAAGQSEGRIDPRTVKTTDLLPMLADLLDVELPWRVDGQVPSEDSPGLWPPASWPASASLKRKLDLFGAGTSQLPKIGPNLELIGRRLEDLQVQDAPGLRIEIDQAGAFRDVDLNASYLPLLLTGRIAPHGFDQGGLDLAVSINGTVRSVARSLEGSGAPLRFAAMLEESDLGNGKNDLRIFAVQRSGRDILLRAPE